MKDYISPQIGNIFDFLKIKAIQKDIKWGLILTSVFFY